MKKLFALLTVITLLYSCKKTDDSLVYLGPTVPVYDGKAFTWFSIDRAGQPDKIAISMDDDLMKSLPTGNKISESSFVLNLNPKANSLTPFNHIEIDWNPSGHPPVGVYDLPHFDFHFYMVSEAEVAATNDPVKMELLPDASYLPLNYVNGPSVPFMGKHWIDITSSEFPPKPGNSSFTQTFVYGSYNGQVTFYEPMITKTFLLNNNYFERAIPQPAKFQKTGFYPTHMITLKVANKAEIILDKFVFRHAS